MPDSLPAEPPSKVGEGPKGKEVTVPFRFSSRISGWFSLVHESHPQQNRDAVAHYIRVLSTVNIVNGIWMPRQANFQQKNPQFPISF